MKVKVTQSCPTLCDLMDYTVHGVLQARILEQVTFPFSGGIFPTQGSNPGLPHCRRILYQLSHKGSPRILEWVAYPFSSCSLVISTLPFSFVPTTVSPLFYLNCTLEFSARRKTRRIMKLNSRLSKLIFHYILTCTWNAILNTFSFPKVIRKFIVYRS